jgi:hypothetical protein
MRVKEVAPMPATRSFYLVLDAPDFEQLQREARAQRRAVRDQAAVMLAETLRQRGALSPEPAARVTRAPEGGPVAAP